MERFLSEDEIAPLAAALDDEATASKNRYPAAAIKLLLLTGCRRGEILNLQFAKPADRNVDQPRDSCSPPAVNLLSTRPVGSRTLVPRRRPPHPTALLAA
jgi:hypothetical protein